MRTDFTRSLAAAILATALGGCSPRPEPLPVTSPQEIEKLTEVTDQVLAYVRSTVENPGPSTSLDTALRQAITAVTAMDNEYQAHSEAILNLDNAEALACVRSQSMNLLDLEILIARREEAARRQDEATATRRHSILQTMAMEATRCASMSSYLLTYDKRQRALQHGAVVLSEMYAIAVIFRVAAGLQSDRLLESQIGVYEALAAKLGPEHESPLIADALPKLRDTLQILEQKTPGEARPE